MKIVQSHLLVRFLQFVGEMTTKSRCGGGGGGGWLKCRRVGMALMIQCPRTRLQL